MSHVRRPDGALEIAENPRLARGAMAVAALAIVYGAFAGDSSPVSDRPIRKALAILGGLSFLLAAARLESIRLRFAARERTLHWSRGHFFRRSAGTIPFESILGVDFRQVAERDDAMAPRVSYQPMLMTAIGELPLTLQTSHVQSDFTALVNAVRNVIGATNDTPSTPDRLRPTDA